MFTPHEAAVLAGLVSAIVVSGVAIGFAIDAVWPR